MTPSLGPLGAAPLFFVVEAEAAALVALVPLEEAEVVVEVVPLGLLLSSSARGVIANDAMTLPSLPVTTCVTFVSVTVMIFPTGALLTTGECQCVSYVEGSCVEGGEEHEKNGST